MPVNNDHPDFALASTFDLSQWAGAALFERDGVATTAPSTVTTYTSAMHMLCGMGSAAVHTLDAHIKTYYGATYSVELLDTDRLRLKNTAATFTLTARDDNAVFGFPATETAASADGGDWIIDATGDWSRDIVDDAYMVLSIASVDGARLPKNAYVTHGIGLLLRGRGAVSDADDLTECLENWDNDAHNNGTREIRWGVDKSGHVYCAAPSGIDAIDTWTTFTRRLGFSGNETAVTSGSLDILTADNPLPGWMVPSRGITKLEPTPRETSHSIRVNSGRRYGNLVSLHQDWSLQFYLDGPGDDVPLDTHWRRNCLPYMAAGAGVVLFQALGEWRRVLHAADVTDTQPAYDISVTSELDGRRGALMLQMADGNDHGIRWPGRLRRRIATTLNLEARGE